MSNSIGTYVDDPRGIKASRVEEALDCKVLHYKGKKPVILTEEQLGFAPAKAVIVGDRLMTDIFMGHQMGMLTILVHPLPTIPHKKRDNRAASLLRYFERGWLARRTPQHYSSDHPLLSRYKELIKAR